MSREGNFARLTVTMWIRDYYLSFPEDTVQNGFAVFKLSADLVKIYDPVSTVVGCLSLHMCVKLRKALWDSTHILSSFKREL
jgi:hypothetical protein